MRSNFDRTISQQSTQEVAYRWILQNIPPKSRVVVEKYDLRLPDSLYRLDYINELTLRTFDDYKQSGTQYVVASSQAFGGVLQTPQIAPDRYARYRAIFDQSQELFVAKQEPGRPGPELRVYRLPHLRRSRRPPREPAAAAAP